LRRFDVERRFFPWFYVILRNCCFKLAAGRKRQSLGSSEKIEILAATPSLRPEETLLLEQMMLELKPEDRELITLKHLDGLSYDELAERLDVPLGTIMSRLYHARKKLRDKLARHSFTGFS
jgi:RNA polymerase sigma-70 factor (ECF subfamily)